MRPEEETTTQLPVDLGINHFVFASPCTSFDFLGAGVKTRWVNVFDCDQQRHFVLEIHRYNTPRLRYSSGPCIAWGESAYGKTTYDFFVIYRVPGGDERLDEIQIMRHFAMTDAERCQCNQHYVVFGFHASLEHYDRLVSHGEYPQTDHFHSIIKSYANPPKPTSDDFDAGEVEESLIKVD